MLQVTNSSKSVDLKDRKIGNAEFWFTEHHSIKVSTLISCLTFFFCFWIVKQPFLHIIGNGMKAQYECKKCNAYAANASVSSHRISPLKGWVSSPLMPLSEHLERHPTLPSMQSWLSLSPHRCLMYHFITHIKFQINTKLLLFWTIKCSFCSGFISTLSMNY